MRQTWVGSDNGNYLWLQYISSSLNAKGRAGVVMANSASDARGSEQTIRQRMIQSGDLDVSPALWAAIGNCVTNVSPSHSSVSRRKPVRLAGMMMRVSGGSSGSTASRGSTSTNQ